MNINLYNVIIVTTILISSFNLGRYYPTEDSRAINILNVRMAYFCGKNYNDPNTGIIKYCKEFLNEFRLLDVYIPLN